MKSFLFGASLVAVSGVLASEFSLLGLTDTATSPSHKVVALKFGGDERRRADGREEMTVTMATGEEVVVPLIEFEDLLQPSCGGYHDGEIDVVVTGCYGEDRSVTIGGQGSWDYEAETDVFRRVDFDEGKCASVMPPPDSRDVAMMNRVFDDHEASGQPISANFDDTEFKMEVRYYYENSLLERYGNDHARAKAAVREMHEHAKVMMRHPTIGRVIHLELDVDPVHIDTSLHAYVNTIDVFMRRIKQLNVCERDVAFHHLITDQRSDGISGVGMIGTVCHDDCQNAGITEIRASIATSATTLAHEFGHNLGALHTHSDVNAGRGCSGIMSYGASRPQTWSDCSRERWTADYNVFLEAHGRARADRCFRPSSGGGGSVSPNPRPTPRPVQDPTPRPVQRPTPRPVQPTPTPPSGGEVVVNVGSSSRSTKVVSVSSSGLRCPSTVTRANWLGGYSWGDRFRVSVSGRRVTVQRVDRSSGWGMNLRFECTTESRPTPTPPSPTPPSPPTSGSCRCSGRTNSRGQGGANCATSGNRGSWCYTNRNACSDGIPSRSVSGQEFSYLACKSGSRPVPAPTPTPPRPTPRPSPSPVPAPPAPTPSGSCRCSGRTSSSGRGGANCTTRGSRGNWCFTALNACSDGIRSRALPGQEYSYLACRSQRG